MKAGEFLIIVLLCVWVSLTYVERAARSARWIGKYAWLAWAVRPLLMWGALGFSYLILVPHANDAKNRFWTWAMGIGFLFLGLALSIRAVRRRRQIQAEFESGKRDTSIHPSA